MKTEIKKSELKRIYNIACNTWKPKIEKYAQRNPFEDTVEFTNKEIEEMVSASTNEQKPIVKEVFEIKETFEEIGSLSDAIQFLGENDIEVQNLRILQKAVGLRRGIVAEQELIVIIRALNGGEELNWNNHNQNKYYSWFYLGDNFSHYLCSWHYSNSFAPARLCFKSKELAEYASTKFLNLYKEVYNY